MRRLRYSINVTLDGCCDHRAILPDEELHRHAVDNLSRADALLFGRVTYEMMEVAFRSEAQRAALPDWMQPFGRTIDAAKKHVVSSTLHRVDWNAELVHGDLAQAVRQLKRAPGRELLAGGVTLPRALAELALLWLAALPFFLSSAIEFTARYADGTTEEVKITYSQWFLLTLPGAMIADAIARKKRANQPPAGAARR